MTNRTITLEADLATRLEMLAEQQGRSLDEMLAELIGYHAPASSGNWALAVAEAMEQADIEWIDDSDASANSRAHFNQHLLEKWQHSQNSSGENA